MSYGKHGLKALGLSFLAVLGLMAFAATAAQGSGKVLVSGLTAPFTVGVTGETDTPGNDRMWLLGLNLELSCAKYSTHNGILISTGHGSLTILLEGCEVFGLNAAGGLVGPGCTPKPSTSTTKLLFLIILHSGGNALTISQHGTGTGSPYLLFTPQDGLNLELLSNENEECLHPEHVTLKGCFVAKVTTTGDQVTHLIDTRGMLALFGCELKYGNNVGHLEMDLLLRLTNSVHGNHEGLAWGVE